MSDVERLTKRDGKGHAYFDDDGSLIRGANGTFRQKKDMTAQFIHQRFVALDKTIDRLAAYEDAGSIASLQAYAKAAEDGRLAILPCKVGDVVFDIQDGTPYATRVVSFSFFGDHLACRTVSSYPDLEAFGERIFLTRGEAEAALAKRKEAQE